MSEPLNPYAPPQMLAAEQAPILSEPRIAGGPPYQSAAGKARFVVVTVGITMVLQLALLVSFAMQIQMLERAKVLGELDQQTAEASDLRQQAIAGLMTVAGLVNFVALLVWIYAAQRNLPSLGARRLEFTPGWAVGWFFIPILNLVRPCQAMFQLWTESDPARIHAAGTGWQQPQSAALVGWWWGLRIVAGITGGVFGAIAANNQTLEGLIAISWAAIALTLLLDLPNDVCQILLVRRIQKNQEARQQWLAEAAPSRPADSFFADPPVATG
ncbi:MAG: DUF4328 domain-containing protein [Pirellulaceae bacterium]